MAPRIVKSHKRAEAARERLTAKAEARKAAERNAVKLRHGMYRDMLKAYNAGLTYKELRDVTGMTVVRCSQILASERETASERASTRETVGAA